MSVTGFNKRRRDALAKEQEDANDSGDAKVADASEKPEPPVVESPPVMESETTKPKVSKKTGSKGGKSTTRRRT